MDESSYWEHLEYRVSREICGFADLSLRSYWCDGFTPEQYEVDGPHPAVTGWAWIGDGPRNQSEWRFTLVLRHQFDRADQIDWASYLPSDDVTGWLHLDPKKKCLTINGADQFIAE